MKKYIGKVITNIYLITILKKMFMTVFNVVITALTVRLLGTSLKGEYAYIINLMSLAANFGGLGIQYAYAIERKGLDEAQVLYMEKKYFAINFQLMLLYLGIGITLFFTAESLSLKMLFLLLSANIAAGQLGNILLIEDYKFHSMAYMLSSVVYFILTVIIYTLQLCDLKIVLFVNFSVNLFQAVLFFSKVPFRDAILKGYGKDVKHIMKIGSIPMITAALKMVNYHFDTIMMKQMKVAYGDIGLYAVAVAIAGYLWYIPDIFKDVTFSKSARQDAWESVAFSMRVSNTCTLAIILGIFIFGKPFISFMYGSDFMTSYYVCLILVCGTPAMSVYNIISPLFTVNQMASYNFRTLALSAASNIVLNLGFIPLWGMYGAAAASVISYSVCGGAMLVKFVRSFHMPFGEVCLIKKKDMMQLKKKLKR